MSRASFRLARLPLAILALVAGCGDGPTGPRLLRGRYVLTEYAGAPLPAPIGTRWTIPREGAPSVRCDIALTGMEITLAGMVASMTEMVVHTCGDGSLQVESRTVPGTQRVEGDRLVISVPGPSAPDGEMRLIARRTSGGIVVERREYLVGGTLSSTDLTVLVFEGGS